MAFPILWQQVHSRLANERYACSEADLARTLMRYYSGGMLDASLSPPMFAADISDKPRASPLALLQRQEKRATLSNLRGEQVKLHPLAAHLLPYLDGAHSRPMLLAALQDWINKQLLTPLKAEQTTAKKYASSEIAEQMLENALQKFAEAALLIA